MGQSADEHAVFDDEVVELMPMNRDIPYTSAFPGVFLVHLHAHQMRHHIGQTVIVIPLHPDHLHVSLWVG